MYKTMNKLSKPLALVLALVMVLGVTIPALATDAEPAKPTLEVEVGEITQDEAGEVTAEVTVTQTKGTQDEYRQVTLTTTLGKFEVATDNNDKIITSNEFTSEDEETPIKGSATATLILTEENEAKEGTVTATMNEDDQSIAEASVEIKFAPLSISVKDINEGKVTVVVKQPKTEGAYKPVTLKTVLGTFENGEDTVVLSTFKDTTDEEQTTTGTASVTLNLPEATDKDQVVKLVASIAGYDDLVFNDIKVPVNEVLAARTELENAIAKANEVEIFSVSEDGKDVLSTDHWTTQEELDTFNEAIAAAQAVLDNEDATQEELTEATTTLNHAKNTYESEPVKKAGLDSKSVLEAKIAEAEEVEIVQTAERPIDVLEGEKYTTPEVLTAFEEAIETAKKALEEKEVTEDQEPVDEGENSAKGEELADYTAEIEALNKAITAYENAKMDGKAASQEVLDARVALKAAMDKAADSIVEVSEQDGEDIASINEWTTQEVFNTLETAFNVAENEYESDLTAVEYKSAATTLLAALDVYEDAKKSGLDVKASLQAKIDEANAVDKAEVSEDGKDISTEKKWTTQEDLKAFNDAVAKAGEALTNEEATSEELNAAVEELEIAINSYETAKKDGLTSQDVLDAKAALETAIDNAELSKEDVKVSEDGSDVADEDFWTTPNDLKILEDGIAKAREILAKEGLDPEEIEANTEHLNSMTGLYNASKNKGKTPEEILTAKSKLKEAIEKAENAKVQVSEDGKDVLTTDEWTSAEDLAELQKVIDLAKDALGNSESEKILNAHTAYVNSAVTIYNIAQFNGLLSPEVKEAKEALEAKIAEANEVEKVSVSEDGEEVLTTDEWTTQEELDTFNEAVAKAEAALANEEATAEELNAAVEELNTSIVEYKEAQKNGLKDLLAEAKAALEAKIAEANEVEKVSVSEDGEEVLTTDKWTTQEELDTFNDAVAKAGEALANEEATAEELNAAVEELETAMTSYEEAQKDGTLTPTVVDRITGEDIYASSVEVAKAMYPEGAEKVIIATANKEKLADALTAGSLANLYNAPVLLVEGDNVSEVVAEYLADGVKEVTVIGGPNTISPAVFEKLEAMVDSVERIQGSNRFQTAVEVAKLVQKDEAQNKFIVANGEGNEKFVDALSASAVSSVYGYPVLVTSADELVKEATAFLTDSKASEVFVIGGESSIKKAVITDLEKVLDKEATVERISGLNRNATAVAVAKAFFPEAEQAVFVNGDDNQLVLVAGTYAGSQNAPVILVGQKDVPKPAKEYLPTSAIKDGTVIGSVESVEEIVRLQLEELVK